jgi:hypothetical protein
MRTRLQDQIKRIKRSFFQLGTSDYNKLLCSKRLNNLTEISGTYRDKIFTPIVTLNIFLWQALNDNGSCKQAIAHLISDRVFEGLPANSFNTGPYWKARKRLSLSWIIKEVKRIGLILHVNSGKLWSWKGLNVLLVDGTTVLMPDTPENQKKYPQQQSQKPGLGFPIARLVGLISLNSGTVIDYAIGEYQGKGTGETSLFSKLIGSLTANDLLLADRYYCSYAIIMRLQMRGVAFLSRNHPQKKADFRNGLELGKKDHIIEWKKPKRKAVWMTQEEHDYLPDSLTLREFSVNGAVYITTLLDNSTYPKKELAELYKERWQIELDFKTLKTDLKMEMLRCKTPEMVEKEIAVKFMAYNLIRGNIAESANRHNKIPRRISFKSAVQLLDAARIKVGNLSLKIIRNVYETLLKIIASTSTEKRNRPPQPRAIKRRPKSYPLLTVPRAEACVGLRSVKF